MDTKHKVTKFHPEHMFADSEETAVYPLLVGHSQTGNKRLHSIQEVAEFICRHGRQGDLEITYDDNTPFLTTCGIYIDKIADMNYRESLLEVLIPMQIELDGTAQINEFSVDEDMDMKL